MTKLAETEIRWDGKTKDYAVYVITDGAYQIVAYARNHADAEQLRTAYLAERLNRAKGVQS